MNEDKKELVENELEKVIEHAVPAVSASSPSAV